MTENDLKNIKFLNIEISRCEMLLKNLRQQGAEEYENVIKETKLKLFVKKAQAETLINEITDDEIRLICKLKFIDLRSWNYIANKMHYDRTTVYKKYKKHIKGLCNEK